LVDDVPGWIIERFRKNTQGPGVYLVSLVCIKENEPYKVPFIYFGFVERKGKNIFIYLNPENVGFNMDYQESKEYFRIIERII
jgi:hypothetical protein